VRPGRQWVPLADFPLAAHQAATVHAADRGLARRLLWPFPRYVNSVLFLPQSQPPGVLAAGHRSSGLLAENPLRDADSEGFERVRLALRAREESVELLCVQPTVRLGQ
jgi:hypothetical protein